MESGFSKNLILTSSFNAVSEELLNAKLLPKSVNVALITTAGDPYFERPWIVADYGALTGLGYEVTKTDLKDKNREELRSELLRFDIIFVAGGNTSYLAKYARLSGFPTVVRDLFKYGKIYIGSSAGSILAGPTVEPFLEEDNQDTEISLALSDTECLKLVEFVVLPHDQVPEFSNQHDKIIEDYKSLYFVRLTDKEYRADRWVV